MSSSKYTLYILCNASNAYPLLLRPPPGHTMKSVAHTKANTVASRGMYSANWHSLSLANKVRVVSNTRLWVVFPVKWKEIIEDACFFIAYLLVAVTIWTHAIIFGMQ